MLWRQYQLSFRSTLQEIEAGNVQALARAELPNFVRLKADWEPALCGLAGDIREIVKEVATVTATRREAVKAPGMHRSQAPIPAVPFASGLRFHNGDYVGVGGRERLAITEHRSLRQNACMRFDGTAVR